jgi:hypothetical protein
MSAQGFFGEMPPNRKSWICAGEHVNYQEAADEEYKR